MLLISCGCPKKVVRPEPIPPPPTPTEPTLPQSESMPVTPGATLQFQTIYFDFDKSDIRPGDADILKANAQLLKDNPMVNVMIEGNCDPVGTSEYNMALGWRRATSAQNYLMKLGIDKSRLSIISYGEERLFSDKESEYWQDRRCDFTVK
jgi:peptidoglycan-associated lipoprotein